MGCGGVTKYGKDCRARPLKGHTFCRKHLNDWLGVVTPNPAQAFVCREAGCDPRFRLGLNLKAVEDFLDTLTDSERYTLGTQQAGDRYYHQMWLEQLNRFGDLEPAEATRVWDEVVLGGEYDLEEEEKVISEWVWERGQNTLYSFAYHNRDWDSPQIQAVVTAKVPQLPAGKSWPTETEYNELKKELGNWHEDMKEWQTKHRKQVITTQKEMQKKNEAWVDKNPQPEKPNPWDV